MGHQDLHPRSWASSTDILVPQLVIAFGCQFSFFFF